MVPFPAFPERTLQLRLGDVADQMVYRTVLRSFRACHVNLFGEQTLAMMKWSGSSQPSVFHPWHTHRRLKQDALFPCSGSTLCVLHLVIPTRPLVLSGNDTIIFGPYHTYYGHLEEHMETASLSRQPNLWDQPLCIGNFLISIHICSKLTCASECKENTENWVPPTDAANKKMFRLKQPAK